MPQVALRITRNPTGAYTVEVTGRDFFNALDNAAVSVRIRGDDEWFDDALFGMSGRIFAAGFSLTKFVPGSALNEDWGQDEVYALVNVQGYGEMKTNTIKGHF